LLALQNGLIDQGALFAAFAAWSRDKARSLADHLTALGHLDAPRRAAIEGIAALHVQMNHHSALQSLTTLPASRSTRERLAGLCDTEIDASLAKLGPVADATADERGIDLTGSYGAGSTQTNGERFRILRPHARGGLGAVFVALDTELHREVALKQILDSHIARADASP
jgi:eukaryotic-like serine/threonine-protein kinase